MLDVDDELSYNKRLMILDISPNLNCPAVELRVFHELDEAQPVSQVRQERVPGQPQWCDITGWTLAGRPCQAMVQKVDDSGEGVAFLLYGGDAGLRLRPNQAPWSLEHPQQWGEPFMILPDLSDVRLEQAPEGAPAS